MCRNEKNKLFQGLPGFRGEVGYKGDIGDDEIGSPGEKGEPGEAGEPGKQIIVTIPPFRDNKTVVIKGDKGEKGFPGQQGVKGIRGEIGSRGPPVSLTVCKLLVTFICKYFYSYII